MPNTPSVIISTRTLPATRRRAETASGFYISYQGRPTSGENRLRDHRHVPSVLPILRSTYMIAHFATAPEIEREPRRNAGVDKLIKCDKCGSILEITAIA
jgi:hypothetical protein